MMKEAVKEYCLEKKLLSPGDTVLAGFSGGADSTALLLCLCELREELDLTVKALHVHHGIRKETADRDEAFCRTFCAERNIPYTAVFEDAPGYAKEKGLSLEEAARAVRFRALLSAAEKEHIKKIALAHHQNDQAETVLFQMIRGSGLKGLSGIPEIRPLSDSPAGKEAGPVLIRPLLHTGKEEILRFLAEKRASWCEDETNTDLELSRNRIRHQVIKELEKIRPDAVSKIAETASFLSEADRYLEGEAKAWIKKNGRVDQETGAVGLDKEALSRLELIPGLYAVSCALKKSGLSSRDVTRKHLEQVLLLSRKAVGKQVQLPGGGRAVSTYDTVIIGRGGHKQAEMPAFRIFFTEIPGEEAQNIPNLLYTKWFDYDKITTAPELRTRREGDVFAAGAGVTKKLSRFFIDEKVPSEMRDSIPVIASGSEILWIVGYRTSEAFKVGSDTQRILEIRLEKEGRNDE